MEVLKSGDVPALVTNIEVMNILSKRQNELQLNNQESDQNAHQKKKGDKLRHRDFVETKVLEYLQSTPCANVEFGRMPEFVSKLKGSKAKFDSGIQPKDSGEGGVTEMGRDQNNDITEDFQLKDAEILQILNHMPSEPVEIHLMIEDLMSRMDEEKQSKLLQLISEYSNRQNGTMEEEEEIVEELIDG
jgi:RNA polymerase Rpb4.